MKVKGNPNPPVLKRLRRMMGIAQETGILSERKAQEVLDLLDGMMGRGNLRDNVSKLNGVVAEVSKIIGTNPPNADAVEKIVTAVYNACAERLGGAERVMAVWYIMLDVEVGRHAIPEFIERVRAEVL